MSFAAIKDHDLQGVGFAAVQPHLRGTALGGFSAFQDLAYGLTGPLAGLLADRAGYDSVFLIGTVAAAAGLLIALSLYRVRAAAFS